MQHKGLTWQSSEPKPASDVDVAAAKLAAREAHGPQASGLRPDGDQVDHVHRPQIIGQLYHHLLAYFLLAGLMALVIRAELLEPGMQLVSNGSTASSSRCTERSCCSCSRPRCSLDSAT